MELSPIQSSAQTLSEANKFRLKIPKEFADQQNDRQCYLWLNAAKETSEIVALLLGQSGKEKFYPVLIEAPTANQSSLQELVDYSQKLTEQRRIAESLGALYTLTIDDSSSVKRITIPTALRTFITGKVETTLLSPHDAIAIAKAD